MSTLKVDGIRSNSATSDAITLADNGTCTANITNNLSNRNLVVNGAFLIAQRSETPVSDDSFRTVDRFELNYGGTDNHPTQAKHALTSSDTGPYEKGFRFSYHVTNGDQSSGAGSGDYMYIRTKIEAQDIANSGWNYTSASSKITFSFWVKSSVSQNFYARLETNDGTAQNFPFETGSLTADQWTKITKTIPGNSNLQFNNDNGTGFELHWQMYRGTDFTDNSVSNDTWAAYASGTRTKDATSTWYTTNDATFEITGVQLEVGSVATDFEHRSYSQELALAQRYYFKMDAPNELPPAYQYHPNYKMSSIQFPCTMRATPTCVPSWGGNTSSFTQYNNSKDHFKAYISSNYDAGGFYLESFTADAEL